MTVRLRFTWVVVALALVAIAPAAFAQPKDDSNISFDAGPLLRKNQQKVEAPEVRAQPRIWPRLDAGAVICRSEADLSRLAARRSGQRVDGPVDCKVVTTATPITIVSRQGPGETEVTTNDPKLMAQGWTDAWLPEKGPGTTVSAGQ